MQVRRLPVTKLPVCKYIVRKIMEAEKEEDLCKLAGPILEIELAEGFEEILAAWQQRWQEIPRIEAYRPVNEAIREDIVKDLEAQIAKAKSERIISEVRNFEYEDDFS